MSSERSDSEKIKTFVDAFDELRVVLNNFCEVVLQSFPEGTFLDADHAAPIDRLIARYDILENQLSSLLNWVTVQKRAFQTIQTLIQWSDTVKENPDLFEDADELLTRMRVMILPAAEMFIQEISQAEKASKRLRDALSNLKALPEYLDNTQRMNQMVLSILQFDEEYGTSLLTDSIYNLYQDRIDTFKNQLAQLKQNVDTVKANSNLVRESNRTNESSNAAGVEHE